MMSESRNESRRNGAAPAEKAAPRRPSAAKSPNGPQAEGRQPQPFDGRGSWSPGTVVRLQRTIGNRAVQRMISPLSGLSASGAGNGTAVIVQRSKDIWKQDQQEALNELQTNGADQLLEFLCNKYNLRASVNFHIKSTDNYANHVQGTIPNGTPYGVSVASTSATDPLPTIYIHEKWIKEWIETTPNVGNLIDTIKHESVHAGQQQSGQAQMYASNTDVGEFEAYFYEIKEAIDAMNGANLSVPLPTEAQIRKARETLEDHYAKMGQTEQAKYKPQYELVQAEKQRLAAFLEQHVDTSEYAAMFKTKYFEAFSALEVVKKQEIEKTHISDINQRYRELTVLFGELNESDKKRLDPHYDEIFDLNSLIEKNEGKKLRFSYPTPKMKS